MRGDCIQPTRPVPPISGAAALFLDIDGTLLDIAPNPTSVEVPDSLRRDLVQVKDALNGALALVSGRSIASIDQLFAPLRLPASGQHGAELRHGPCGPIEIAVSADLDTVRRLIAPVAAIPGVEIEDKGLSLAIHHRNARIRAAALRAWMAWSLRRLENDLEIIPGPCVFDIKPRGVSKGTAIEFFMARSPFAGRRPVFIGDHRADEEGFRAVTARGGLAIQVGPRKSALAQASIENPAAVRQWLATVAKALAPGTARTTDLTASPESSRVCGPVA